MKYRSIEKTPEEILSKSEKEKFKEICDEIYHIKADKISNRSLKELFDVAVYLQLAQSFYRLRYAQTFMQDKNSNPYFKEMKDMILLIKLMPYAYGNVEKEIMKHASYGIIARAKGVEGFISKNNKEAIAERIKKEMADIEDLEALISENKE